MIDTQNKHRQECECGNPAPPMSDAEYNEYINEYGEDCPVMCEECSIDVLEMAGWTPDMFAKHTPDLARYKQEKLAKQTKLTIVN